MPKYSSTLTMIYALGLVADLGGTSEISGSCKKWREKRADTMKGKGGKTGTQVLRWNNSKNKKAFKKKKVETSVTEELKD